MRERVTAILVFGTVAVAEQARVLERGTWQPTPVRTVASLDGGARDATVTRNRFGGWQAQRLRATGFFRVEQVDGRWWFVDPEGCPFISVGLNSVNREGANPDLSVSDARFGSAAKWGEATATLLTEHGFNSLGCWSDWRTINATRRPMPYFPRWNFMSTYKNQRDSRTGPRGYPGECMPLFDAAFEAFCDTHAGQLTATRDDPWLVGHFSDNELPFRPNLLDLYLNLPETDSGNRAAREWLSLSRRKSKRAGLAEINAAERDAFLEFAARRYYTLVGRAIRRHDPNHLYVGSRIHGRCIRESVFRGAESVDVVSVNYYHRWSAEHDRMTEWVKASGRPFIVTEWYAQQVDRPGTETSGAGFRVATQRDRGLFYQNMGLGLLEHPGCVGWHWFKYGGDGAGFSKGIVTMAYEPYTELLTLMGDLNGRVYSVPRMRDAKQVER